MGVAQKIVSALLLAGAWLAGSPALAEKRVALVIGNSSYDRVAKLSNPVNDASIMAETFKGAGFDSVDLRRDLKINDMRRALREFVDQSSDADVAVVYFAGHGIEIDGVNYLIPVDAVLDRDRDIYDEGLSLERVLVSVEPAKKLRLVILDACRDNPFTRTMKRTLASRAIGRGLAKVEPTSANTLIAFASKAGSTATDGDGKNSPFTAALVKHVTKPGLDLRKAFGYVRDDVLKSTNNRQEPYLYGSLGGDDLPLVPAKPVAINGPQGDPQSAVRRDYELALQVGDRGAWEAFVQTYPDGFYANLAKGQLRRIAAEEARATATAKARLAEQEKARLEAEGARQAEQAKAAATAKAAEEARIAAEKVKQIEQEKAAAGESARLAEQEKVRLEAEKARRAELEKARLAEEKANQAKQENAKAAEQARIAAENAAEEKKQKLAAVTPADKPDQPAIDLRLAVQSELRRVGCDPGAVDGNWNATSQKAIDLFNKHAGTNLDVKAASADALDAVKSKMGRVCPLICAQGYRAEGDRCVKITCRSGYQLNDDGACGKIDVKRPTARRVEVKSKREPSERAKQEVVPARPQASGQIYCDGQGCRPVRPGCTIARSKIGMGSAASSGGGGLIEICN
jgi:hypothetical protein